jgi:hypothetical protein
VQLVKAETGQIHVARIGRCVQSTEDKPQAVGVLRLDPARRAGGKQTLQPLVSKSLDRHRNQCNLCGYRSQSG